MNAYRLAVVNGNVIDLTDIDSVMVHGADNYSKANDMLERGVSIQYVKSKFCGNCGGELPCGCDNSYPQAEEV